MKLKFKLFYILLLLLLLFFSACSNQENNKGNNLNLIENNFKNYSLISILKLNTNKSLLKNNYNIKAYVVYIYSSPSCLKGALCKQSMKENIVISNDKNFNKIYQPSNNSFIIFTKNITGFKLKEKYIFSVKKTNYKSTSSLRNDFKLIGYKKI